MNKISKFSKLRMFKDDIKRSAGFSLAMIMVLSNISVPVEAAEPLKIIDNGGFVAMGYKPEVTDDWDYDGVPDEIDGEYVFQEIKTVVIDNTAQTLELSDNAEINADLYVTIGEETYKVMEFSSNPPYDTYDYMLIEKQGDYYYAEMAPVYYQGVIGESIPVDDNDAIDYEIVDYDSNSVCCPEALNFGFSDEIVEFFEESGITKWEDRLDFLQSDALLGKYVMEYTLSDNGNAIAEYTQNNMNLANYRVYGRNYDNEIYKPSIKVGKEAGYNRIESLLEYHENGDFSHIKMYKGDIYVDASQIDELNGVLKLPNKNTSGFYNINSVYVNDNVLYNDGYSKNTMEMGYNISNYILPSLVDTKEEAVDKFLEILAGKIYAEEDFATTSDYGLYGNVYWEEIESGLSIDTGDSFLKIYPHSYDPTEVRKKVHVTYGEAYDGKVDENDEIVFVSMPFTEYTMSEISFDDSAEFSQYIDNHLKYLRFLNYLYLDDTVYNITTVDKVIPTELYYVLDILRNVSYMLEENSDIRDWSSLNDEVYSIYNDEGKFDVKYTDIVSMVPVVGDFPDLEEYYTLSFEDMGWATECDASEFENLVSSVGLNPDDLIVSWTVGIEEVSTAEELETAVKDMFGDEAYNQLREYICEEYITYNTRVVIEENVDSQKDVSVDVYADTLEIPLSLLDTTQLGKDNYVNQLWYAGNAYSYLLIDRYPVVSYLTGYVDPQEMLMHGELVDVYWDRYISGYTYYFIPYEPMYSIENGALYRTEFGTIKFAKAPSKIQADQEAIVTTDNEVELTWDVPENNGAEILGYQIAVVPRNNEGSKEPADNQYITVGENAGSYTDIGDNYEILYTTTNNSFVVNTDGKSVDVYVRAVNVIGASQPQKITINNPYDIYAVGNTVVTAGDSSDYDVVDYSSSSVESECTYSIQGNPEGVSIDANGVLTVDKKCRLSEIVIVVTGTGIYADRSSTITVTIEPKLGVGGVDMWYVGLYVVDGQWVYITDGEINTSYTGMAENKYGWWYVKDGVLDRTYTGMLVHEGKWIYVNKGKYDTTYTGMAQNSSGLWYMKDGVLDRTYTGMLVHKGKWIYVNKGKYDTSYTGMAQNSSGLWYMKNGVLDRTYTGMLVHEGKWIYVNKGKHDTSYTGMAQNSSGWWYMKNGNLDRTYTGMAAYGEELWYVKEGKFVSTYTGMLVHEGKWIYVNKGKHDTTYTGMAKNSSGWWYMKNGVLDRSYTGMLVHESKWIYVNKGKHDTTYTGMAKNSSGWWYMKNGVLDRSYTGMLVHESKWIYVNKGKYDTTYTGVAKNSYGWWYMKNGVLDRTYTGTVVYEGTTYKVTNGKVAK